MDMEIARKRFIEKKAGYIASLSGGGEPIAKYIYQPGILHFQLLN